MPAQGTYKLGENIKNIFIITIILYCRYLSGGEQTAENYIKVDKKTEEW